MRAAQCLCAGVIGLFLVACSQEQVAEAPPVNPSSPTIVAAHIEMPDGVRLAADLFMPIDAADDARYPVLLEYTPYRKDESRARNAALYSYFIDQGYVVARVDIRGTGNSEGETIPYEYSDIELDDGEVVIDWLASQPWSTGKVGMFGISWGGFNAIQMAMRQPEALKAYVALMATESLYAEDVHYIDGIIHTDSWMMSHDLYNAMPGAPDFVLDDDWERNRFNVEPSVFTYMRHQRNGPFWDRASSLDRHHELKVPGYHIGGWYDGYRNSLPRMLEHAAAPTKAMIGPWDHYFPHNAWPEPQVEWRAEATRWFDQWLKGQDTGILDEPRFAVYVRDYHEPDPDLDSVPGHWRWEQGWPIERADAQTWYPQTDHQLRRTVSEPDDHLHVYRPSMGLEGGGPTMWWGSVLPDQQPMDDHSLVYDSAPLDAPLEILGRPLAELQVSATAPRANWILRVSDVAPNGAVTQVAAAAINGTHRNSSREPEDVPVDEVFNLTVPLHFTSWVFPKGHRIRVAISNAQWPMLWPTPLPFESTLNVGGDSGTRITLPVMPPTTEQAPNFLEPVPSPQLPGFKTLDSGNITGYAALNEITRDPDSDQAVGVARNSGATRYPWGIERFKESIEHRTSDESPAHTSVVGTYSLTQELQDRTITFEQDVDFRSDAENFYLTIDRRVRVDGALYRERQWSETIPRDFQ